MERSGCGAVDGGKRRQRVWLVMLKKFGNRLDFGSDDLVVIFEVKLLIGGRKSWWVWRKKKGKWKSGVGEMGEDDSVLEPSGQSKGHGCCRVAGDASKAFHVDGRGG
jgi:hypothetical protein